MEIVIRSMHCVNVSIVNDLTKYDQQDMTTLFFEEENTNVVKII